MLSNPLLLCSGRLNVLKHWTCRGLLCNSFHLASHGPTGVFLRSQSNFLVHTCNAPQVRGLQESERPWPNHSHSLPSDLTQVPYFWAHPSLKQDSDGGAEGHSEWIVRETVGITCPEPTAQGLTKYTTQILK